MWEIRRESGYSMVWWKEKSKRVQKRRELNWHFSIKLVKLEETKVFLGWRYSLELEKENANSPLKDSILVIFHCIYVPHLLYPFICWWTLRLLSHKKKRNWAICSEVDGPRDCHTEWSKSEREKLPYANTHIYGISK